MIRRPLARIPVHPAYAVAVAAVGVLQGLLIARHSYFVDEWQALLIAVQSPDWGSLVSALRYEGHPPGWYALLRSLAAIVGPGNALAAASVICAFTTLLIIAFLGPFPPWQRIALMLGEPLLFEYGTVSRGYSLCVALVFVTLAMWQRRRLVWLPLAILPLVDFLGGLLALALIVLHLGENGWRNAWRPGVGGFVLASLAAAASVAPAADFVSVYNPMTAAESVARWLRELSAVTLPWQWNGGQFTWDVTWHTPLTIPLGLLLFVILADQTRVRPIERVVAIGFPLALLAFMVAIHPLAIRHLMLSGIAFVAIAWRQGARGEGLRIPARLWLAAGAVCGLGTAAYALTRPFDTAPLAARAIEDRALAGETWLSFPVQHAQGVAALTGIRFEGLGHGCAEDYVRWNFPHRINTPQKFRDAINAEAARGGTFYLLSGYDLLPGTAARRIAVIRPGLDGKDYFLFEVPGRGAGRRATVPPCVSGLRPMPRLDR